MNKEHLLYISPEDDLPGICTRLEHAHSKHVVLVMPPLTTNLRSLATWRTLHAYTRQQGIKVHIVSEDAYVRSVARNARFTVAHTLDTIATEVTLRAYPAAHKMSRHTLSSAGHARRVFQASSSAEVEESMPPILPILDIEETFLFDDTIGNDNVIPLSRANPAQARPQKAPQPLDIQRPRHSPPASQRLPWDDIDEEAHQHVHPIKRRSGKLVPHAKMRPQPMPHTREPIRLSPYLPILCIGLFIVIRAIIQFIRSKSYTL